MHRTRSRPKVFIVLLVLGLFGCAPPRPPAPLRPPAPFEERKVPDRLADDGDRSSLLASVEKSLIYMERIRAAGKSQAVFSGGNPFLAERSYRSLVYFRRILLEAGGGEELSWKVRENFSFWQADSRPILLTGYYEPVARGSTRAEGEYRYPLYRRPDDLLELKPQRSSGGEKQIMRREKGQAVPYYSRREIDSLGSLQGKGYELLWLMDPWERFVLHVQGSGKILLPDGRILRVGFAASNGRPYRSIGRYLVERGFIAERAVSMERIKQFIRQNPGKMEEIFNANERYVFFRLLSSLREQEGPIGALGFSLTSGRSVASDLSLFPRGALAYLVSTIPVLDQAGNLRGRRTLRRFVLNQDTGAAMQGAGKIDFFCGSGAEAGMLAGAMREEGAIYFLLAK